MVSIIIHKTFSISYCYNSKTLDRIYTTKDTDLEILYSACRSTFVNLIEFLNPSSTNKKRASKRALLFFYLERSFMISPAIISPITLGQKAVEPGVTFFPQSSLDGSGVTGISLE